MLFGLGFSRAFALYWGEQQTCVRREFGRFEAVEARALAREAGEASDKIAIAETSDAVGFAVGGAGSAVQPSARGENSTA